MISSIGVANESLLKTTPILRYGLEVGLPKILKSVLGNAATFSIPVKVGFAESSEAKITALAPAFSNVISKIGKLKIARKCNSIH